MPHDDDLIYPGISSIYMGRKPTAVTGFLAQAVNQGADWYFSTHNLSTGDLTNGASCMEDVFGVESDITCQLAATGNWSIIDTDPAGADATLAQCIQADVTGNANDAELLNLVNGTYDAVVMIYRIENQGSIVSPPTLFSISPPSPRSLIQSSTQLYWNDGSQKAQINDLGNNGWRIWAMRFNNGEYKRYSYLATLGALTWDIGTGNFTVGGAPAVQDDIYLLTGLASSVTFKIAALVGWNSDPGEDALAAMRDSSAT